VLFLTSIAPCLYLRYFAGTEDGAVHKCSCSYHEQYLDTYSGHGGPVYRVRCSPFAPTSALLSCSADWTVKLWNPSAGGCAALFSPLSLCLFLPSLAGLVKHPRMFFNVAPVPYLGRICAKTCLS